MSMTTELAQRTPERKRYDWSQSVMRDCDFCNQWSLTVKHEDGARICASCCDAEYTSKLEVANAGMVEALEAKEEQRANWFQMAEKLGSELDIAEKRIAELEASHSKLRETLAGIHNAIRTDGSYTPLAAILNAAKRAHEESAAAAGVAVEGE